MLRKLLIFFIFSGLLSQHVVAQEISFNHPLVDAADRGNETALINLLQSGAKVDSRGEFGVTALMRGAYHGHVRIVKILASAGADSDAVDYGGATALHLATRRGHARVVKILLQMNADVDEPDDHGVTPLMKATTSKNKNLMQLLVKHGANPDKKNKWGETAKQMASQSVDPELKNFFGEVAQVEHEPEPVKLLHVLDVAQTNTQVVVGLPWLEQQTVKGLPWLEQPGQEAAPKLDALSLKKTIPTQLSKPIKPKSITVAKAVRVPLSAKFTASNNLQLLKQIKQKIWIKSNYYDSEYEALLKYQEINNGFPPAKFKAKIINIISDQQIRQYSLMIGPIPSQELAKLICQRLSTDKQVCSLVED